VDSRKKAEKKLILLSLATLHQTFCTGLKQVKFIFVLGSPELRSPRSPWSVVGWGGDVTPQSVHSPYHSAVDARGHSVAFVASFQPVINNQLYASQPPAN